MASRATPGRPEPPASLLVLDRLAPAPPLGSVADLIDRHSAPGGVVLDLDGRGGRIARAAIDRQRRAITLESSPLTRVLAELVLRPPDVRHLDAAFQALGASPRGDSSLRLAIGALFATRCPTCGRTLIAEELTRTAADGEPAGRPIRKQFRCTVCRDQQGGTETRQAPADDEDVALAAAPPPGTDDLRERIGQRYPVPATAAGLRSELLALHSDRQLVGLAWILERIDTDLRAEPIEAALRLSFLHAVLPASRLARSGARPTMPRIRGGHLRLPAAETWRERNPWLAFEDGFRAVRTFVQHLDTSGAGPVQARFGEDLRGLADGPTTAVVRTATPATLRAFAEEGADVAKRDLRPRIALALGQPPRRPTPERVALELVATSWALGREAAAGIDIESLLGPPVRSPWGWQAAAVGSRLAAAEPLIARDGRAVVLLEDAAAEQLVAAALGGAGAGYRIVDARLGGRDRDSPGIVEFVPPGASLPPGPRTRANVRLAPVPGGAGDPQLVPGRGLFGSPERVDARPFSPADAARTVAETAAEVLKQRGEPAPFERLLAEILVGLDRAGLLRRLATASARPTAPAADADAAPEPGATNGNGSGHAPDPVEDLIALIRGELSRAGHHRLVEIEPDRWWLADRDDRLAAAAPLADRVEWAVYSLLSTSSGISEAAFLDRVAGLFGGYDVPDDALVRACLESYRDPGGGPDRLTTSDDLVARSSEQSALLAAIVDGGHRLGLEVWLGAREQTRRVDGIPLGARLTERERSVHLPVVARGAVEEIEAVDVIWYARGRMAFAFEVEWTAMIGELLLRRHARIPPDDHLVRFLVVPSERAELVRYKLDRSPLLRAAFDEGNWHVLKWNHLRAFLAADPLDLDALEPLLGFDPVVERTGEQLPLFAEGRYA